MLPIISQASMLPIISQASMLFTHVRRPLLDRRRRWRDLIRDLRIVRRRRLFERRRCRRRLIAPPRVKCV
jgi:hypothetical protein